MKNKLTGWKDVFSFTFRQSIKTKSIKISTLILCVIALLSMPIFSMINGDTKDKKETSIKKVYVVDSTEYNLINNMNELKSDSLYGKKKTKLYTDIEYSTADIDFSKIDSSTKQKDIYKFKKNDNGIYMVITYAEKKIAVNFIYDKDSKVDASDVDSYVSFIEKNFRKVLYANQVLSEDKTHQINSEYEVVFNEGKTESGDKNVSDTAEKENAGEKYGVIYTVLMISMFALAFGGERIAMSIITEKSSKVMEFLMTSIRPMAVIVGKVLASLLVVFIQLGAIAVSYIASVIITGFMNLSESGGFKMPSILENIFSTKTFAGASPLTIVIGILLFAGGFIFFSMIAGLAGACVSRIEEVSEGLKMYTTVLIIGAYIAIYVVSGRQYENPSIVINILCLLPFTSTFMTPALLCTGYFDTLFGLGALLVMAGGIILLVKLVAGVYESLIYYNGSPLKIKDIISLSKQNKGSSKSCEGEGK